MSTKGCINKCMAALFEIIKNQKKYKWPSIGECVNKLWNIHTIEYNSTKKEKQPIWKNLQETIFLKRIIYSMIPFIQSSRKYKTPDQWLPGDVQGATDIFLILSHRSIHWSKFIKSYTLDG